jgi:hypothetical protein
MAAARQLAPAPTPADLHREAAAAARALAEAMRAGNPLLVRLAALRAARAERRASAGEGG